MFKIHIFLHKPNYWLRQSWQRGCSCNLVNIESTHYSSLDRYTLEHLATYSLLMEHIVYVGIFKTALCFFKSILVILWSMMENKIHFIVC